MKEYVPLWVVKATYFLSTGGVAFIARFLNVFFFQHGLSVIEIAWLSVANQLSSFFGSIFWSNLGSRTTNIKAMFCISFFLGSGSMMLYIFFSSFQAFLKYII